jgi:hypothetical protein
MSALHTEQLEFLLTHLAQRVAATDPVISLGVFPANCVPSLKDSQQRAHDACFILNTDPHDRPGKHWLAFYYDSTNRVLEFFDSYGFPLKNYKFIHSAFSGCQVKIVPVNVHGNLQAFDSFVCGFYCILYLHWRMRYNSCRSAVGKLLKLSSIAKQRDAAVVKALHKIMHAHKCASLPHVFTIMSQSCKTFRTSNFK